MALQAPNLRDSSPNAADTGDDIVRATHWGCRTGLNMKMEEVTGTHRRQVESEEMHQKSKFLCDAFWAAMEVLVFEKRRPCLLTERGNKFYLLHTKKLRLWSLVTTPTDITNTVFLTLKMVTHIENQH